MTMKPLPQHTHLHRLPIVVQKDAIPVPQDTLELRLYHRIPLHVVRNHGYTSTTDYPSTITRRYPINQGHLNTTGYPGVKVNSKYQRIS